MSAVASNLPRRLHKISCYAGHSLRSLVPSQIWHSRRQALLAEYRRMPPGQQSEIDSRVAYYNRLSAHLSLPESSEAIGNFCSSGKSSAYCGDFLNLIRHFPPALQVSYLFGDITEIPSSPHFVKSRPITRDQINANSVLLKLNSVRHYWFCRDRLTFGEKKPLAVWRGKSNRQHRVEFATRFANHPLCDIGCTLHKEKQPQAWHRDFLSVAEQLQYQFIVSVEGVDVATNLKWIMASNSLCLMRRPRYETWFMEGALIPDYHYVQLKDDHSDLEEKILYYREHPDEAQAIIANANRHVARFLDPKTEQITALLVMEKFLQLSGQTHGGLIYHGA